MDAAAIAENAGNSGRERRLGKGCEHVQTWSGVFTIAWKTLRVSHERPQAPPGIYTRKINSYGIRKGGLD